MSQFLKPSAIGSSGSKDSISVISCRASPLPGKNGTFAFKPAFFIACSIPTLPANTIVSAMLIPNADAIGSKIAITLANLLGSLPCHSFCGKSLILAPFAPPRLSEPLKVLALSHAVETISEIDKPVLAIFSLTAVTSYVFLPSSIGSCQIKFSFGTSGPK